MTYGNGHTKSYAYDNFGNASTISYNGTAAVKNLSDASGNIIRTQDLTTNLEHRLSYDSTGRLISRDVLDLTKTRTNDKWLRSVEYDFDDNNNVTKLAFASKNGSNVTKYTYGEDNLPTQVELQNGKKVTYTHDAYGRLTRKDLNTSNHLIYTYEYMDSERDGDYTTTKIKTESIGENKYEYTYDVYGNIKQIYFVDSEGDKTCKYTYTYDSNNQLTAVNDKVANTYTTYTYDDSGNITRKYVQNLHPSYGYPISVQSDVAYTYTDSTWKDLLTSYNGQTITYDAIGNPLTYRDGITLTWQNGRGLASFSDSDTNVTYTYDAGGMRTGKVVTDSENATTEYSYVYEGGLLLQMSIGSRILDFSYDANGTPVSFRVTEDGKEDEYYYYGVNSRGDIVSIYNVAGGEVVQYTYDAYGKILSEYSTTGYSTIATANPLRYRGYVYDRETGLYYLQSRYYDPETCRFINADGYCSTGQGITGNNMFAYCNNNPVMFSDISGAYATYSGILYCGGTFSGVPMHQLGYLGQIKDYWVDGEVVVVSKSQLRNMGFENVTSSMVNDLNNTMQKANINSINLAAHFLAQCAVETNYGMWLTEIGDESYFNDNGYGYKYRGAGYIQLTWDYNYKSFAEYMGDPQIYEQGADYVADNYAWAAAGWFWTNNNINSVIFGSNVDAVTSIVNYYTDSYAQRRDAYYHIYGFLG